MTKVLHNKLKNTEYTAPVPITDFEFQSPPKRAVIFDIDGTLTIKQFPAFLYVIVF